MHILLDVILLLAVATAGLLIGHALRVPSVVAYLVGGVLVGPGGLGLVSHSETVEQLAELGVALLLFGVGIEFSLEHMRRILGRMIATGAGQVILTIGATALAFRAFGAPWTHSFFLGFLVSLSSTAVVFKLLDEAGELDAPHGVSSAAILLFQDLALVPMMLLVPFLAQGVGSFTDILRAMASAAIAVALLLFLSRAVLPRLLRLLAKSRAPELFPLGALVIAFGTALGAVVLGLSPPIGAFLAGLALSGSPYAHQVFAEHVPLRDAFVAIFFTSIGMLLDPATVVQAPGVFAGLAGLVLFKGLLVAAIVGVAWRSTRLAILTGLGLAQIGEFSFVLAREGVGAGILSKSMEQSFLGVAMLTMATTPFLLRAGRRLSIVGTEAASRAGAPEFEDHVLLVGYGITGQSVAHVLRETGIPFVAVDMAAEVVEVGRRENVPVRFGDATRRAVLEQLGAARARAVVVAVADPMGTRRVVALVRQMNKTARLIVRARRVAEITELERLGADEVLPAELEVSIEILVRLLVQLGVPRHVVRVQESLIRLDHYQALRGGARSPDLLAEARKIVMGGILETAQVMAGSPAASRTLRELNLRRATGTTVLIVVREGEPKPNPDGDTRLAAGDLLVLYGPHEAIARTQRMLEPESDAAFGTPLSPPDDRE